MCLKQRAIFVELKVVSSEVLRLKAADYEKLCIGQARSLEEASLEGCSRKLYEMLRQLKPYVARRGMRLSNESKLPAGLDHKERIVVRKHFKERLVGTECSFQSLIDDDRASCARHTVEMADVPLDIDAIPSIQVLTLTHAKGKMNGVAEAGVGGEAYRLMPDATAKLNLRLQFKAASTVRLPL